ncbi:ADP-ribosyl cyclase/cyclic ADP-ribose hydrolase [Citrus sinensis]|nr:ADP-ribosyl cyclase/cyclic ADP-ribose hydrolase [Citrus sinensis]
MASTSIQNISHWKYDAFLSFRGADTRKRFTGHLYAALKNKGLYVFKDDKELERGRSIPLELLKAIEESRISIIVFSQNYASSTWCLDELVKIVECKNAEDQIFPIFYDVEPTVVTKQTGNFHEAFAKHEEVFRDNKEKVQKWRDILKEVANISGWELKQSNESELIEEIVNVVSSKIRTKPETLKELVGMDSRCEKLRFLMDSGSSDVRMIGICGMGGLGKTTIARVVYDLISHEFEASGFLDNVREISSKGGLVSLQRQLLSQLLKLADNSIWNVFDGIDMLGSRLQRKKVLLVIDDVVDVKQLQSLAGNREWFGSGSRIIITSRDEHLLKTHGVDEVYKPHGLNYDEALQLFNMKAFKTYQPLQECVQLSARIIRYAGGLPLALEVLGSFLSGRSVDEWRSTLERLEIEPPSEILDILQISFDGLQELEKKIFLDIACFFKGNDRDYVTNFLEGCGFHPVIGIRVLIEKCLITVHNNTLWMHDLLQELGQQIVQRQSPEELGKRSRLWKEEEVCHVLTESTGTELVEGIVLDNYHHENEVYLCASAKAFSKMTNLRLLKICNLQLPNGLEYLSNSRIGELWKGIKHLDKLKVMILSHSENLIRMPDFTGAPNLEKLILEGCTRLYEIHPSLLLHNKLIILNMKDCTSLITLPGKILMKSLEKLVLSGCSKLKKFPDIVGSMECLLKLLLDGTAIEELPLSIKLLSKLVLLVLNNCKNLKSLPTTISGLKCLSTLDVSGDLKFREFPEIVEHMEHLSELHLEGTAIRGLPLSIELLSGLVLLNLKNCRSLEILPVTVSNLKCLRSLKLSGCSKLKKFPEIVRSMKDLSELFLDGTSIKEVPSSIELLTKLELLNLSDCKNLVRLPSSIIALKSLKTLNLSGCFKLENVPETLGQIESLEELDISGTAVPHSTSWYSYIPINLMRKSVALKLPSLSGLCSLRKLNLTDCNLMEGALPSDIGNLCSLKELYLSKNSFVSLPTSITHLSKLLNIELEDCKRLQSLPQLPPNIRQVRVNGCASLVTLLDALKLCKSDSTMIACLDSLKLLGNKSLAFSMLREYLEAVSNTRQHLSVVVPGSEIPEWFMYQNEGSSITVTRPSNLYNKKKLVGYAICCVFHVLKNSRGNNCFGSYPTHQLNCHIGHGIYGIGFRDKFGQAGSDHLWLLYLSRQTCYDIRLPLESNLEPFESNHVNVSFEPWLGQGLEVKMCGLHPVYMDEVEELDQTTNQPSRFTVYNLNEFDQHFVGSKMIVATTSKRSLTEYFGAEASGSGCCDDEEPQPKRFRELE